MSVAGFMILAVFSTWVYKKLRLRRAWARGRVPEELCLSLPGERVLISGAFSLQF